MNATIFLFPIYIYILSYNISRELECYLFGILCGILDHFHYVTDKFTDY
jgi:hypothetical protein